jgi:hypothetical protein
MIHASKAFSLGLSKHHRMVGMNSLPAQWRLFGYDEDGINYCTIVEDALEADEMMRRRCAGDGVEFGRAGKRAMTFTAWR